MPPPPGTNTDATTNDIASDSANAGGQLLVSR